MHAAPGLHEWLCDYLSGHLKSAAPGRRRILELGSGAGALTARLRDAGFDVVPVDIDASKWQLPEVALRLQDLNSDDWRRIEAEGAPFDVVLAVEVIEHLENPSAFVRKAATLVRPGGLLVVSTPNITSPYSALTMLGRRTLFCFNAAHLAGTGHISMVPWWLLVHLFEQSRLHLEGVFYVGRHEGGAVHTAATAIVTAIMRLFSRSPFPVVGDGLVTVAVATRPA